MLTESRGSAPCCTVKAASRDIGDCPRFVITTSRGPSAAPIRLKLAKNTEELTRVMFVACMSGWPTSDSLTCTPGRTEVPFICTVTVPGFPPTLGLTEGGGPPLTIAMPTGWVPVGKIAFGTAVRAPVAEFIVYKAMLPDC